MAFGTAPSPAVLAAVARLDNFNNALKLMPQNFVLTVPAQEGEADVAFIMPISSNEVGVPLSTANSVWQAWLIASAYSGQTFGLTHAPTLYTRHISRIRGHLTDQVKAVQQRAANAGAGIRLASGSNLPVLLLVVVSAWYFMRKKKAKRSRRRR